MSSLKRVLDKVRLLGFFGLVCCVASRVFFSLLRWRFNFAKWHATAPVCCRPYKRKVANVIQALGSKGLVEVGCGLGDIGRLVQKACDIEYYGIDRDSAVLDGARFLASKNSRLKFEEGSIELLKKLPSGRFDTLLLLNWPHEVETKTLTEMVTTSVNTDIQYLLIDCIKPGVNAGFRYRHTSEEIERHGFPFRIKKTINDLDEVRDLLLFER